MEKYEGHPDRERIIAHEMGWTELERALDEQEAAKETECAEDDDMSRGNESVESVDLGSYADYEEEPPDPNREGIDWVRDADGDILHPVAKRARDALCELFEDVKADGEDLSETDEAIGEFVGDFMILRVKLAAALGSVVRGERLMADHGLTIAWLKRALEIHNQALTSAAALEGNEKFPAERLAYYRSVLFTIREEMLALIAQLRKGGK
jgi:hypothetical protein